MVEHGDRQSRRDVDSISHCSVASCSAGGLYESSCSGRHTGTQSQLFRVNFRGMEPLLNESLVECHSANDGTMANMARVPSDKLKVVQAEVCLLALQITMP